MTKAPHLNVRGLCRWTDRNFAALSPQAVGGFQPALLSGRGKVLRKFGHHRVGVVQGDVVLFSDYMNDGTMWTGEGQREARSHVTFSEPFVEVPLVTVCLTMFDMSNTANARADVQAEDVTAKSFAIVFRTWGDTRVARVRVGWQAIGPVRDAEDWALY